MSSKRPNIILITSDQQRADCNGFENPDLRTPHLDRLARRSVVFDAAYTSTPVCVPARASLVSGRFGYEYAWRPAEEWIRPDRPTIPRLLDAAGSRTVACGRMHFQPLRQSHGFQEMVLCEHGGPENYRRDDYHPWPDPGERHNLAGGPAHRQTEEAMRRALGGRWTPVERGD